VAYIETIRPDDADGELDRIYREATRRAGRVYGILRLQSLNPAVLEASIAMYKAIMFGASPLSRIEREAIAVTVSRVNQCFY
jgi:alkylhydroperoxidase family enzyme